MNTNQKTGTAKTASFEATTMVTIGEAPYYGPSTVNLAALDAKLAKEPFLRFRRTGPAEYVFWPSTSVVNHESKK